MKKIILITRTWKNKKIKDFIERIYKKLYKIIVLVNCEEELNHYTQTLLRGCKDEVFNKIKIIHAKPWGEASGALNIGLAKAFNSKEEELEQILIASPEVELYEDNITKMSNVLSSNKKMLVVGYALSAHLENLEEWQKGHSLKEDESDALKVPWNTCAMWDADLFLKNIGTFNIICDCPEFLREKEGIKLQGMEDALAIALAIKNNPELKVGLIKDFLKWHVDPKKIKKHIEKMKRKCLVYERYKEIFGGLPALEVTYFNS